MLDEYYDDLPGPRRGRGWHGLPPSLRSALIMWLFLFGIALFNSFTGHTSIIFCYPIQWLLYIANGYVAGRFALDDGASKSELARVGALAGFFAWIMPAVYYVVFSALFGLVTLGVGLVGMVFLLICGPIDLVLHAVFGIFGAWLAGRNHQEPSDW